MISTPFKCIGTYLWHNMCFIIENVSYALEKNVFSALSEVLCSCFLGIVGLSCFQNSLLIYLLSSCFIH